MLATLWKKFKAANGIKEQEAIFPAFPLPTVPAFWFAEAGNVLIVLYAYIYVYRIIGICICLFFYMCIFALEINA